MAKERIFYLDFIRAMAIICVVWYHSNVIEYDSYLLEKVKWFTGKCGVPLFFMISGYLAFPLRNNLKSFFHKKVQRIILPFVAWTIIYGFVAKSQGWPLLAHDLLNEASAHLWFIYAIVGLYLLVPIINPFIEKTSRNVLKNYLLLWGCTTVFPMVIAKAEISFTEHSILYTLYYSYGYIGYFLLGNYIRKYHETRLLQLSTAVFFILASFGLIYVAFFVLRLQTVVVSDYKGIPIVLYSIAMYAILYKIGLKIQNIKWKKIIIFLSDYSFGIYLCHMLMVIYVYPIIPRFEALPDLLITFYFVVINIVLSTLFVYLVSKIKYVRAILG